MNYIGIDLGWGEKTPSGLAAWTSQGAFLRRAVCRDEIPDIVRNLSGESVCVVVDAPLIIRNETGQRPCEKEVSEQFGRHDASAHTMNLSNSNARGLLEFSRRMLDCGLHFLPPSSSSRKADGCWLAEVYPHPAQIALLDNLPQKNGHSVIHKYKKGRVDAKRKGMREFADDLRGVLRRHMPAFAESREIADLFSEDYSLLRGKYLKAAEDALDACFCVLIAQRIMAGECHYFGDLESGLIAVPK